MGIRVDLSEAIQLLVSSNSYTSVYAISFSFRVGEASIDKIPPMPPNYRSQARSLDHYRSHLVPLRPTLALSQYSTSVRRLATLALLTDLRLLKQYPQTPLPSPLHHQIDITPHQSRLSPFKSFIIFPDIPRLDCSNKGSEELLESWMGG
jgi:hypothetical protein